MEYRQEQVFDNGPYQIIKYAENSFSVDHTYYDSSVGYVTDSDIFSGSLEECLDFINKRSSYELE